jgi:hypothetical protein
MKASATWKNVAVSLLLLTAPAMANFDAVDGPNVRVMRHEDGSRTMFTRSPDNRTLTKKTYSAEGRLFLVTVYRMDANGNPRGCKILDGKNQELFKVSYGYHRETGLLVEERMFDSRAVRRDPVTQQEMPVRRFIYTYDAQGRRSAPTSITLTPGRTAEEVYGATPSALERNPFQEPGIRQPINPNARPAGR